MPFLDSVVWFHLVLKAIHAFLRRNKSAIEKSDSDCEIKWKRAKSAVYRIFFFYKKITSKTNFSPMVRKTFWSRGFLPWVGRVTWNTNIILLRLITIMDHFISCDITQCWGICNIHLSYNDDQISLHIEAFLIEWCLFCHIQKYFTSILLTQCIFSLWTFLPCSLLYFTMFVWS